MQARYDTRAEEPDEGGGDGEREQRDGREQGAADAHEFLRCPTCVEAVHGMRYAEWVSRGGVFAASGRHSLQQQEPEPEPQQAEGAEGGGDDTALSLCEYVSFEEGEPPPLFLNEAEGKGKKPKWCLCQGVGPPALEVDSSRSGVRTPLAPALLT